MHGLYSDGRGVSIGLEVARQERALCSAAGMYPRFYSHPYEGADTYGTTDNKTHLSETAALAHQANLIGQYVCKALESEAERWNWKTASRKIVLAKRHAAVGLTLMAME